MISHSHRCIFVHIPKTAGNSINRAFGVGWQDHKDLQRYFDETPAEAFERYFKFAIVRNPWDRLFSDYNYQKKKSHARASKLHLFSEGGCVRDFAEWVEAALNTPDYYDPKSWGGEVSPHIHRWSPQVDWITVAGVPRVDFVARLENLPHDFRLISARLGLATTRLPHRNRRLHWHYSHYYDRTTRDIVARYYTRDIAQFGYEFERPLLRVSLPWPRPRHSLAVDSSINRGELIPASSPPALAIRSVLVARRVQLRLRFRHRFSSIIKAFAALTVGAFAIAMSTREAEPVSLGGDGIPRNYVATSLFRPVSQDPFYRALRRAMTIEFHFFHLPTAGGLPIPVALSQNSSPAIHFTRSFTPSPISPPYRSDRAWWRHRLFADE